jgi:hypothetical protein
LGARRSGKLDPTAAADEALELDGDSIVLPDRPHESVTVKLS